ncbi:MULTISPECIES: hypothetical protein [Bacillaceae]|uniref:hypothetical protein n=1 Tax=Bacillaceae TaxID=186817 RepID=UPI000470B799|nr:hypothetical protein [Heyndrickxia ginsengihumi]
MIEGFQKAVNQLIENRLGDIINSEEYRMFSEAIYRDLEDKLSSITESLNEDARNNLIEDIKSNIFEQVFYQSKLTYRVAFNDSLIFLVNTLLIPKK